MKKSSLIALVLALGYVGSSVYWFSSLGSVENNNCTSTLLFPGYFLWIVGTLLGGFFGAILGYFISVGAYYFVLLKLCTWIFDILEKRKI